MTGFRRAERRRAKFRIALDGPSGSGKTWGALTLARGLVRNRATREDGSCRIGVINTEREGAEIYAGHKDIGIPYDCLDLAPPFTAKKYLEAIQAGAQAYDVLIIDSLSHAWSGEGGILEATDRAASGKGGNKWAAWAQTTPQHNAIISAILQSDCHVICTLRAKTAWEVQDDGGKKRPIKIGLAPDQRAGIEYEFTAVLDIAIDGHVATASKDRTSLLDGTSQPLTAEIGRQLIDWMETGAEPPAPAPKPQANGRGRLAELYELAQNMGIDVDSWKRLIKACGITKDKNTQTPAQLASLEKRIQDQVSGEIEMGAVPMPEDDVFPVDSYEREKQPEDSTTPATFASDEAIDTLCRAAQAAGLAKTPKELTSFLKFHVKSLPEDFSDVKTLTADECQKALGAVDKWGGETARQQTAHGDAWEGDENGGSV